MIRILFVCLGNICRSPLAEGIFKKLVEKEGLGNEIEVDSAGTSRYHIGKLPDDRMRNTAKKRGLELVHRGREAVESDLLKFNYIVAMDSRNFLDLKQLGKNVKHPAKILLMRDFDPVKTSIDVPDPYFEGEESFENVYEILYRSNVAFLKYLKLHHPF